jgi:3-hydroxyacyl-CoA dehydrogenase/enoyl-CoA hydratase/3-hydroxybutyryl-CoA epimerase
MSAFTSTLEQGIAVVCFDVPGAPVNTISQAAGEELAALLDRLAQDPVVRGVVLISGSPTASSPAPTSTSSWPCAPPPRPRR